MKLRVYSDDPAFNVFLILSEEQDWNLHYIERSTGECQDVVSVSNETAQTMVMCHIAKLMDGEGVQ